MVKNIVFKELCAFLLYLRLREYLEVLRLLGCRRTLALLGRRGSLRGGRHPHDLSHPQVQGGVPARVRNCELGIHPGALDGLRGRRPAALARITEPSRIALVSVLVGAAGDDDDGGGGRGYGGGDLHVLCRGHLERFQTRQKRENESGFGL